MSDFDPTERLVDLTSELLDDGVKSPEQLREEATEIIGKVATYKEGDLDNIIERSPEEGEA